MTEQDWARPVVRWEIQAIDAEQMSRFYSTLFNWTLQGDGKVKVIPPGIGAPEPAISGLMRPADQSRVVLYIQVRDLRASMEKAVELGGQIVRVPFDVGSTTLAWIDDPEGNRITLVQQ